WWSSTSARRSRRGRRAKCRKTSGRLRPTSERRKKMALLELTEVHAGYGAIKALHGVSVSVEPGSIVAILGANGAGKTTTLRSISGMVKSAGRITFDGKEITNHKPEDIARRGIAHV